MSENEWMKRLNITQEEIDKGKRTLFDSLDPVRLKVFSPKEKKKLIALSVMIEAFSYGAQYTESDVNGILKPMYEDFATVRRAMIDYGFLARSRDGRAYWRKEAAQE